MSSIRRNGPAGESTAAATVVRIEAAALEALAQRLEGPQREAFERLTDALVTVVRRDRRIVLAGIGKSGLIARKIAATLVSMGVPAAFLHPAEALHGDLGILRAGDAVLLLSYSGETEEITRLLPLFERLGVVTFSLCGCLSSTLAGASEASLDVSVDREACTHALAPTTSTTVMLALGDALAIEVSRRLGFAPQNFADLHPGGQLGRRLTPLHDLMHVESAVPVVAPDAPLPQIMHEMSAKRFGMTTVQGEGQLLGLVSDGDLRRLMEREGPAAFAMTAGEIMQSEPRIVGGQIFAGEALALMEDHKITSLIVTEDGRRGGRVLGVVHMHDLLQSLGAAAGRR